jgi:hypothetical protein
LIVIMIVRPQGLLGARELHHLFRRRSKVAGPTGGL